MSMIAEQVFEAIKTLPDQDAAEVLDFVEFLKAKRKRGMEPTPQDGRDDEEKTVTAEEHAAWCERLRHLVESQPMTESGTVERMRQEARY